MNKFAIVTGGAIRVGKEISLKLADEGYNIILIYNSSKNQAEETQKLIENNGKICEIYQCDISNSQNLKNCFEEIFNHTKQIELLVNNASIFEKHKFEETTEELFDKHFDINLKAPYFISQYYYNYCKKNNLNERILKGHIVNILDSYINTNSGAYFSYLLSKKTLFNFTEMLAKNAGEYIRVNAVSIGLLLASKDWDDSKINQKSAETPLKSRVEVNDVTNAIIYLDKQKNITGQNIFVDSGLHLM